MEKVEILKIFLQFNYNTSAETLEYIQAQNISEEELKDLLRIRTQLDPVISLEILKQSLKEKISKQEIIPHPLEDKSKDPQQEISHKQQSSQKDVIKPKYSIDMDIPYKLSQEPKITVFRNLFLDRYQALSKLLLQTLDTETPVLKHTLKLEEVPHHRSGILIGIIHDTQVLHTNRFVIQLEDHLSGHTTKCVIVKDSPSFPEYRTILRDSVVGIAGVLPKNFHEGNLTAFWGKDIIRPSFKDHHFSASEPSTKVLCLSDIHFGSKRFSRRLFTRLIAYLNGKVKIPDISFSPSEISTIIIAGDLVEGTGLVTNEDGEHRIDSYEKQYEQLNELLNEIPERITIFTIPGEHDASHLAIPQPAIDKKIGKALYSLPNVKNHGNPLRLTINKMKFLIFHARSCESIFHRLMKIKQAPPILGFKELLEYRHLSPEYGSFIAYAPYPRDYLVVNEIPDVMVTGHFHQAGKDIYKGVRIATCGTFKKSLKTEEKTDKKTSIGVFPVVDTGTGEITMIDFKKIV
ncbi:MAG: metallophosphoesterase [Candidatus Hodarchaeales archaeon]|jgi:DNA polymerase II small subunit